MSSTVPVAWATGHSLGESYSSAEMQSVYSKVPVAWATVLYTVMRSITTVILNTFINAKTGAIQMQADSAVQVRTHLLVSVFGSSTRRERRNSNYAGPTNTLRIPWCLRSLSAEIRKTPAICLNSRELNSLCPNGRELIYLPSWQKPNNLPAWSSVNLKLTLLQKPQILGTISSGHYGLHTPAHFLSGVYYDNGDCHILWARA